MGAHPAEGIYREGTVDDIALLIEENHHWNNYLLNEDREA